MIVGIDVSPLHSGHKVRGIGFYTKRLIASLKKIEPEKLEIKELENKKQVKEQNYDVLHIPYFSPYFLTMPWPGKISKPMVVTIHDLIPVKYPHLYPPGIKAKIRWQLQKMLLKQADLVITDSFASKYDINDLAGYPLDKTFVIYLAAGEEFERLETRDWEKGLRVKYDLPEEFCLYVGDVNRNKNVPNLVKACQQAKMPLIIVGKQAVSQDYDKDHPENKDLVWLQNYFENCNLKIGNSKFLNLVGFVPTEDLVKIYNLATVYCQPSIDEGFGLPVLEAMACGCPVVSSNQGSLTEVVGEAGLVTGTETEKLAEAIIKVKEDDSRRQQLVEKGLARAKEFSWENTAKETVKVYRMASEIDS